MEGSSIPSSRVPPILRLPSEVSFKIFFCIPTGFAREDVGQNGSGCHRRRSILSELINRHVSQDLDNRDIAGCGCTLKLMLRD